MIESRIDEIKEELTVRINFQSNLAKLNL